MQKGLKKYFVNMDDYLASLGLYRKMVARDAANPFRAVSEQLYCSQNYHHTIRQACADFMRANTCVFEPVSFCHDGGAWEDETVGQVEIKALSQLYRRRFLIYRYPGKAATLISEDDFVDKVTLSCSINGHYDIVYPRSYPASAALCQAIVYELLYTKVFGCEEAELSQATEAFRVGGRRYRNSLSVCSDVDFGYEISEDRGHRYARVPARVYVQAQPASEAPPPGRLSLPYKVLKSLDGDVYRNVEFDVWQDTCKGRRRTIWSQRRAASLPFFLGGGGLHMCVFQVRLEPKGKYFNAFIQEVGTHSAAVTVFIEELGEKPARYGAARWMWPQRRAPPHRPAVLTDALVFLWAFGFCVRSSSSRLVNRHLIGPQLTYYPPTRRYYDYDSYAFRSRARNESPARVLRWFLLLVAMAIPATPWLVNELGEGLCSVVAPPPYSYDPSGSDLPRDCRVLQYYFNLGVQVVCVRVRVRCVFAFKVDVFGKERARFRCSCCVVGPAHPLEGSSLGAPPGAALYPEQVALPSVLHLPYEAPPPTTYLSPAPPPPPGHSAHHPYHTHHACAPASAHWGGHASRVYCPAPNAAHVVGYVAAPPAHFIPPSA
uniref:ubiquitinyl hydrolase 1 n=1 Tax=Hippocampus comes TaxID=109280 RepID=A0A3Q3DXL6_HIPCM